MAAKIAMRCSQRIREIMAMGQGNERLVDCINNGTEVARSAIAGVTYSPAIVIGPANHPVAVEPLFMLCRREPDASAVRHVSVLCRVGRGSVVQTSRFCVSVQVPVPVAPLGWVPEVLAVEKRGSAPGGPA